MTRALIQPFPQPGPLVELAYWELWGAENGTAEQRILLGDPRLLPRPFDPASCTNPQLRAELWGWLDAVVSWLNTDHAWDTSSLIPGCWPHHPHLIHQLATLADRRRSAGQATTGEQLEDWHRHALPSLLDRLRGQLNNHCENGHQPPPTRGRCNRYLEPTQQRERANAVAGDCGSLINGSNLRDAKPANHAGRTPPWS